MESKYRLEALPGASDISTGLGGLTLVKTRKPALPPKRRPGVPGFSAAEIRHNFALWALEQDPGSKRRLHLYYCIRCKWAFSVDDRRGVVTPVDSSGKPIQGAEAAQRLATFSSGPCPVFNLTRERRRTQKVVPIANFRERLAAFLMARREVWKARFLRWHQAWLPRRERLHESAGR